MFTRLPVVKGREPSCLGDCGHISRISHPIAQKCGKYFEVEISKECLMSRFPNLAFYVSTLTNHPYINSNSNFINSVGSTYSHPDLPVKHKKGYLLQFMKLNFFFKYCLVVILGFSAMTPLFHWFRTR